MLIALIILYGVLQCVAAACIYHYGRDWKYKRIIIGSLLLCTAAWAHVVNAAILYQWCPNKYGVVLYNPIPLFVSLILSLLALLYPPRPMRLVLYGIVCIAINFNYFGNAFYNPVRCENQWDGACCLQTTDSTCAAAAAATLLKLNGIETTEEDMKHLCLSGYRGTNLESLYYGLRSKVDSSGKLVLVSCESCDAFLARNEPAIIYVVLDAKTNELDKRYSRDWGWTVGTAHAVVFIRKTSDGKILMADPGTGLEQWHEEGLKRLWFNVVVSIRNAPEPNFKIQ
ncbi:MAG: hypothetical protein WCT04_10810 [Planctomycetota bacterium]